MSKEGETIGMSSYAEYTLTVGGQPVTIYRNLAHIPTGAMMFAAEVYRGTLIGNLTIQLTFDQKHTETISLPAGLAEQSIALTLFSINSITAVVVSDAPGDTSHNLTLYVVGLSQVVLDVVKEKCHH